MSKPLSPPTIHDVAKQAGVSISTVSRVINRSVPVSAEVLDRVQAAMKALRYVPRAAARNLATSRTNSIGLLLSEIIGDFFGPLLNGIESAANAAGYALLISTAGRCGPHAELPGSLGAHNSDGLLVFAGCLNDAGLAHTQVLGLPVVLIHQSPPTPMAGLPCVTIENKAAACAIVEHLIQVHGCRQIVLLRGPQNNEDAYWREMGYREALETHRLAFDTTLTVAGDFNRRTAQASVAQLLTNGIAFDSIFTGDDESAVGAYLALQAAGKHIPHAVKIVGFDDQRLASILNPALTTVRAPTEQVGVAAVRQLIRLIKTGQADPLTLLPTQIVIRRSCGCEANQSQA